MSTVVETGFKGISFPFRIGNKGGVVMSSTSSFEVPHILESIQQILTTKPYERGMEMGFHCSVINNVFDINNESLYQLVEYQIREALEKWEDRIEVDKVEVYGEEEFVYADITFTVKLYSTVHETRIKVGDLIGKNSN